MVGILIVEPSDIWIHILMGNIMQKIPNSEVTSKRDYQSVDSLLGLTQGDENNETYDLYVINTDIPRNPDGEVVEGLGIGLANKIIEIKRRPSNGVYLVSTNPDELGKALEQHFSNLYLRGPLETNLSYKSELLIFHDLKIHAARIEEVCTHIGSPK